MSEEIAVGRRSPGAAAAALTLCCALPARGSGESRALGRALAGAWRPLAVLATLTVGSTLAACGADGEPTRTTGSTASANRSAATSAVLPKPRESAASRAGARACSGRTPARVRQTYIKAAARRANAADRKFLRAVSAQHGPTTVPLAARLYSMTVSKSSRVDAFSACAHVLSLKESSR
jgi:hypothetical protein